MSILGVIARRTIGMVHSLYSTALAYGAFLAASGTLFAFGLEGAEGGGTPLGVVWASAVAPVLPILAALLSMDIWSDERRSGRILLLLTAPVRERGFAIGKFIGVWLLLMAGVFVFFLSSMAFVLWFAPSLVAITPLVSFLPSFFALALQGALWCAISLAASAAFRHAAAAAMTSIALTVALPRAIWAALMAWAPQGRLAFGAMPLDEHAFDLASGLFSSGTILSYVIVTIFALFVSSKTVASLRFVGRGARALKWSTTITLILASCLVISLVALLRRVDVTVDIPLGPREEQRFSERTQTILAETHGEITVTAFLSRRDTRFRALSHFLRALAREAEGQGGARLLVRYVDPRWDFGAAQRLVRLGVHEDSLVFERGRRIAVMSLADGFGDRQTADAILRIAMPPQRRSIYWTVGHGESSFETYGPWGMSDIARDLVQGGYRNLSLDLATEASIPADCALVIIAGAKSDFSRAETARLDAYLRKGGRILVLISSADPGGVATLMTSWGIRPVAATITAARTLSGTDVIVSDFSDHPVCDPLKGSQIVLEKPVAFTPSAAAEGAGADRSEYSELARVGDICVAALAERGALAGDDLALRPTRVIALGDVAFALNGQLASRANANRDFFHNCIAFLSGTDTIAEPGTEAGILVSGMDRAARAQFLIASGIVFPFVVFITLLVLVAYERRRS